MSNAVSPAKESHGVEGISVDIIRPENAWSYEPMTAEEGRTDVNNARRLSERYGHLLRWVADWKAWAAWDDRRWVHDKETYATKYASEVGKDIWRELADEYAQSDPHSRGMISKFATHTNSGRGARDMVHLAKSMMVSWPREFESSPMLLNVANGTIDLETGKLRPHDPEDRLLNVSEVVFDQKKRCPTWERFLSEVFGNRKELVEYVRRLIGYTITGRVSEQVMIFCYGGGANGKGTFYGTISRILGEYWNKAPRGLLLWKNFESHPTDLADLYGKRLVVCSETGEGRALDETLVKELTGGDPIRARRLYENNWEFWPTHKLWLVSNHKPRVVGSDHGIWRRIKVLPFEQTFTDDRIDKDLDVKLTAELPGILAWAVRGCLEWQREGLPSPVLMEQETRAYRQEQDVVQQFVDTHCDVGESLSEGATALYERFKKEFPEGEVTQNGFGSRLRAKGFTNKRSDGSDFRMPDNLRGWKGLQLKATSGEALVARLKARGQGL